MNQASRFHVLTISTAAAGLLTAAWADEPALRIARQGSMEAGGKELA